MGKFTQRRSRKASVRRAKSAVSLTKTAKVESDTSAQLKAVLDKTAYNSLITKEVLGGISKTVLSIDKVLSGERKISVKLGGLLGKLREEFFALLKKDAFPRVLPEKKMVGAFRNFVRIRFKIGSSRTDEYIKLSGRTDIHNIELPVSALIELCRLETPQVGVFLKNYPVTDLQDLSVNKIKKLVSGENPNKRERKKEEESPQQIAEKLKSTFEVVKDKFDDEVSIDKDVDTVLGQISKWYFDKKVA